MIHEIIPVGVPKELYAFPEMETDYSRVLFVSGRRTVSFTNLGKYKSSYTK